MQVFERAPRVVVPPAEQRIPEVMVVNEPVRPEEMAEEALDQPQEPQILNQRDQPENNPVANIVMMQEEVDVNQVLAGARQAVVDFQGGGDFLNIGPGGKANRITQTSISTYKLSANFLVRKLSNQIFRRCRYSTKTAQSY